MARPEKPHSKPELSVTGKLVEALEKIQIYLAREDYQSIWYVCEKAIQLGTSRH